MAQNDPEKRVARLQRIIQLKALGFSDQEVSEQMKEEGYRRASQKTVSRIINSREATEILYAMKAMEIQVLEELKRNQLRDIAASTDERNRLEYRDRLLGKLLPKKIEQRIEGASKLEVEASSEIRGLLRNYYDAIREAGRIEDKALREDDTGEPVDTEESPPN